MESVRKPAIEKENYHRFNRRKQVAHLRLRNGQNLLTLHMCRKLCPQTAAMELASKQWSMSSSSPIHFRTSEQLSMPSGGAPHFRTSKIVELVFQWCSHASEQLNMSCCGAPCFRVNKLWRMFSSDAPHFRTIEHPSVVPHTSGPTNSGACPPVVFHTSGPTNSGACPPVVPHTSGPTNSGTCPPGCPILQDQQVAA